MSKIGKAFMSLVLDKKAREALQNVTQKLPPSTVPPQAPQPSVKQRLDTKLEEVQNRPAQNVSPSRQQLIQDAIRVRASKQEVLSDLSQEQRLKLQVLAMKAMMPNRSNDKDN
jgi:hypothetical protein